ncbi:MAG TPA: helix-turn-helix domain-containing protein [Kribbella sp.]|nr:helix-turn-helix domain-containing protein [Kribbella sp.]
MTALVNGGLRQLADALPSGGSFLAIIAEAPLDVSRVADRLRTLGVASVWQELPGVRLGVLSLRPRSLPLVIELLERIATGRVGVSPLYDAVDDIQHAVRLARIALGAATTTAPVAAFGRSPLTMVAIADPAARRGVVQVVLGGLDGMPQDYCDVLLDTLAAWSTHNGSAVEAATYLYCHPNTVRYRLRRIEERTGRSLSDPRAVAELLLALEAHRYSAA